ncbi:hypothetical protein Ahy_B07g086454 isoform B [Arachis hypogaea]|uniref:Aminotransferase-like plant mobile domain-containing protein n=1 Tax=Arachis hypogaea TaxID=3818 RepID=A0A444Y9U0_ARAHY|nr:hypothetical protein Ahy_B07g086454 isoform B [Arachis hypogaea]
MPLRNRIIPYLERAGLYHLARLNAYWFWLDEPLVSAFIKRWQPETHTFHMLFGECTITLHDVAYQLGLPVYEKPVSECLTDFHLHIEGGRPAWEWFHELFGELPPPEKVKQYTVHFTWFHERFRVLPADAFEETVRIYARAYIMMLLSTQLFGDKVGIGSTFDGCHLWRDLTTWATLAGGQLHLLHSGRRGLTSSLFCWHPGEPLTYPRLMGRNKEWFSFALH